MRKFTAKPRSKKAPKRVLALPDLEQAKTAVLNSLTSVSGQRTYDHAIREFVAWYCSEPRLAFNRTVVLRYRIHLEQTPLLPGHDQPATRRGAPRGLRSCRCRAAQSRTGSGHSPRQGRATSRRSAGKLAHARAGTATVNATNAGHPA